MGRTHSPRSGNAPERCGGEVGISRQRSRPDAPCDLLSFGRMRLFGQQQPECLVDAVGHICRRYACIAARG
jgi:hypothetical protein